MATQLMFGSSLSGGTGGDEDNTIPEMPAFTMEAGETIRRGDVVAILDDGRLYTVRPGPDSAVAFDRGLRVVVRALGVIIFLSAALVVYSWVSR